MGKENEIKKRPQTLWQKRWERNTQWKDERKDKLQVRREEKWFSLSLSMAQHHTVLLPQIRGCKLFIFSSQRKEAKKKRCSSHESHVSLIVHGKLRWLLPTEESRKSRLRDIQSQRVCIYIYIYIKRSFTGKELRIQVKTVRLRPRLWIHVSCVCVCVCNGGHYSRRVCPSSGLVLCSCRHVWRMTGSGWASVLNTQSSRDSRSSSENSRYRYLWSHKDRVNKTQKNTAWHSLKCPYYVFLDAWHSSLLYFFSYYLSCSV